MSVWACLLLLLPMSLRAAEAPRSRTFLFTYSTTLTGLTPGKTVRVWLPVPSSSDEQQIKTVRMNLRGEASIKKEPQYGNKVLHFEAKPYKDGTFLVEIVYRVTRKELKGPTKEEESEARVARFLRPDSLVPIEGKPLELIKGKELPNDPMAKAHALYEVVERHMKYDKSRPGWGKGDAAWACESGFGNCSDFHSLFISLARSQKIPAKFEIGFGLPEKRGKGEIGGYHCWAKFRPNDKGWVGVDISEASKNPRMKDYYFGNLTEDRVTFSEGRDLILVPAQEGKPLNFFVYPYAEVDGKPLPTEKFKNRFRYEDVR